MAINLKEIFEGDSDFIKTEKINYNFDQILANGGGPAGPQGTQGTSGVPGTPGGIGPTGPTGLAGPQGSSGASTNFWDRDETWNNGSTNTPTTGDFYIIRPYNYEDQNDVNTNIKSRVLLGDRNVDVAGNSSGTSIPNRQPGALLSLLAPEPNANTSSNQGYTNAGDAEKQLEFLTGHGTELYNRFYMYTVVDDYTVNNSVTLKINSVGSNNDSNFHLNLKNVLIEGGVEINTNAPDTFFRSQNSTNVYSENTVRLGEETNTQNTWVQADEVFIRTFGNGVITIGNMGQLDETDEVRIFNNTDFTLSSGGDTLITNTGTTGNITIQGNNSIETRLVGSASNILTSSVSNELNSFNNKLSSPYNELTTPATNELKVSNGSGKNLLSNDGVENFKTESGLNTSDETIFFSDTNGEHDVNESAYSYGDGIRFKAGGPDNIQGSGLATYGHYAAPNHGAPDWKRTQSDYFYKTWVDLNRAGAVQNYDAGPTGNWLESSLNGPFSTINGSGLADSGSKSFFSYTKIGHQVMVNGQFRLLADNTGSSDKWSDHDDWTRDAVVINLDADKDFPFRNATTVPILVNISSFGHDMWDDSQGEQSAYFNGPGAGSGNGTVDQMPGQGADINGNPGLHSFMGLKGIIQPGSNKIIILADVQNAVGSASNAASHNDIYTRGVPPSFFSNTHGMTILFNFQMPALHKSYDRVHFDNQNQSSVDDALKSGAAATTGDESWDNSNSQWSQENTGKQNQTNQSSVEEESSNTNTSSTGAE